MNTAPDGRETAPEDTIAAAATAPGEGGIGIIRVSGPEAARILDAVFRRAGRENGAPWESHRMYYGFLTAGEEILDEGMAVLMRAPRSWRSCIFTAEPGCSGGR